MYEMPVYINQPFLVFDNHVVDDRNRSWVWFNESDAHTGAFRAQASDCKPNLILLNGCCCCGGGVV